MDDLLEQVGRELPPPPLPAAEEEQPEDAQEAQHSAQVGGIKRKK